MRNRFLLNHNWSFKLSSSSDDILESPLKELSENWLPATLPGTVHTDLLDKNIIPDPFYSDNENKLKWIDNHDWEYRTSFHIDKIDYDILVFEGIDTVADIYLNESLLFNSDNMFVKYRIDISGKIHQGKNSLRIVFKSAKRVGLELENKYGKLPVELESHRVYLRKAQYSYGWDWGPGFPTSGIWKSIYLARSEENIITNVKFVTQKIENNTAHIDISYDLEGDLKSIKQVVVQLENDVYKFNEKIETCSSTNRIDTIRIENPELWYPHGAGKQILYTLKIIIESKTDIIIDEYKKRVGIRTVELELEKEGEESFRFIVNGKPLFIKGVNWIPADSFLPRVDSNKYERILALAKESNVNMVRVWGGGVYEEDIFYETCDKLGLLVWQDFMFACASYPEHGQFIDNIKDEIKFQVSRLRNYPSLAIWCGNNENEWIWHSKHKKPLQEMSGYKIFHEIIPELLKDADSSRPYWPSSPFGFDEDPNSFNSGNTHQWNIWSHWIDYEEVAEDKSLFVTEFGFQGPANIDTLNNAIPEESRSIDSEIFKHHNKQVEGPERINFFLENHLPVNTEWEDYIYLAQLNQAFALKTCLEHWRTNGKTNGSIIWQLNDCWPVTSWAIIDSESTPKLSYYFVKNIFSPCIIHFLKNKDEVEIYFQNQSNEIFKGNCRIYLIDSLSGSILKKMSVDVTAENNSTINIRSIPFGNSDVDKLIILARLYDDEEKILHSNYFKLHRWKEYQLAQPDIKLKLSDSPENNQLVLTTDKPAFFVDLYAEGIRFSDRGFSILPDEEVKISILNEEQIELKASEIKIYSLNKYLT